MKPIFFDPANRRWPRLRLGIALITLILTLLLGALILGILAGPVLPTLDLPGVSFLPHGVHSVPGVPRLSPERPLTRRERALRNTKTKLVRERERNLQQLLVKAHKTSPDPTKQQLTVGFFVNWDDSSMNSLKQNLDSLDMVIAEWLHLADDSGLLREDDPNRQAQVTEYTRLRRPDLPLVALVNNWNGKQWEGKKLGHMLADPAARKRAIEQLLAYVERQHFAGVSIDFEDIAVKAQPNFQRFVAELYAALNPKGLSVSVNVPAANPAFNYRDLARNADYLILMAYDEHWASGSPGPIAGLPWFADVLRQRQRDVPAKKMIVAIGNYAYDWEAGHPAEERSFEEAVLTAKESEGNIALDPVSLNPTFDYSDDDDHIHHVWMLDA
ncbi:MAG: glycosyl hydrolase family 18 protein, partial [Syntrophobacteraceae bacterium]